MITIQKEFIKLIKMLAFCTIYEQIPRSSERALGIYLGVKIHPQFTKTTIATTEEMSRLLMILERSNSTPAINHNFDP